MNVPQNLKTVFLAILVSSLALNPCFAQSGSSNLGVPHDPFEQEKDKMKVETRIYAVPRDPIRGEEALAKMTEDYERTRSELSHLQPDFSFRDGNRIQNFASSDGFFKKLRQWFATEDARYTLFLSISRGIANGVTSGWALGAIAGTWEGSFSAAAQLANGKIQNAVNWGEKNIPGGGMTVILVIDVAFLMSLMAAASLGPVGLNLGLWKFLEIVGKGFVTRGLLEWAVARHRELDNIRSLGRKGIDIPAGKSVDDVIREYTESRNQELLKPDLRKDQRRADLRAFGVSLASTAAVAFGLPASPPQLSDLPLGLPKAFRPDGWISGMQIPDSPLSILEFVGEIYVYQFLFGVLFGAGVIYSLWNLKQTHGKWSLAIHAGMKSLAGIPVSLYNGTLAGLSKLAGLLSFKSYIPGMKCQALHMSLGL